ncbi:nitrilase-like protein 2 [Cucumis melo var. makuwa]|uniref:Nitrilase-like protein 2 n=1 Tax=Cucumis melo var. makuwa TaxID=1194695 RepID=A0A5A7SXN3_CUCMM|nr:nitrilase-like protein 2 [Cucumis melo var. makuwa]
MPATGFWLCFTGQKRVERPCRLLHEHGLPAVSLGSACALCLLMHSRVLSSLIHGRGMRRSFLHLPAIRWVVACINLASPKSLGTGLHLVKGRQPLDFLLLRSLPLTNLRLCSWLVWGSTTLPLCDSSHVDRLSTGIAVADIDFDLIEAVRTRLPIAQQRKPFDFWKPAST